MYHTFVELASFFVEKSENPCGTMFQFLRVCFNGNIIIKLLEEKEKKEK